MGRKIKYLKGERKVRERERERLREIFLCIRSIKFKTDISGIEYAENNKCQS